MNLVIVLLVLVVIGFLLNREIYFYEGVHLGPRVQAWLYDRWSRTYDAGKRESQLRDDEMLAGPLSELLKGISEPFVLDFATGTGRLSFAVLKKEEFKGRIVALDLSQGMLEQAASKLSGLDTSGKSTPSTRPAGNVELLRHTSLPLPFRDASFDAVCCLEVLELFPSMDEPLAELTRVLRPGGILLTSRGTEESGRKAKVKSKADFTALLEKFKMNHVTITPWWKLFDRAIAVKAGNADAVGRRSLSAVLRCRMCDQTEWRKDAGVLRCQGCGNMLSITTEGIVLN